MYFFLLKIRHQVALMIQTSERQKTMHVLGSSRSFKSDTAWLITVLNITQFKLSRFFLSPSQCLLFSPLHANSSFPQLEASSPHLSSSSMYSEELLSDSDSESEGEGSVSDNEQVTISNFSKSQS